MGVDEITRGQSSFKKKKNLKQRHLEKEKPGEESRKEWAERWTGERLRGAGEGERRRERSAMVVGQVHTYAASHRIVHQNKSILLYHHFRNKINKVQILKKIKSIKLKLKKKIGKFLLATEETTVHIFCLFPSSFIFSLTHFWTWNCMCS